MKQVQLGLKENRRQFTLLVIVNAFVGGMIGLERAILPQLAEVEFQVAAKTVLLSFIIVFGVVKALTNYFTGALADRFGRKRLLLLGWILALPVPFILMFAPSWDWIVAANALLGVHQGLAWSATVMMKIDLVGERQRGFAMGLNEFAGYVAVALAAFLTGWIAGEYGLRPYPFYLGVVLSVAGLIATWIWVEDTGRHVAKEWSESSLPRLRRIFSDTTWRHRNLGSVTQAGFVNNLNDGMAWGVLPLVLAGKGFSLGEIGLVASIYPAVWGVGQLFTGKMADRFCKKDLLYLGMFLQGVALILLVWAETMAHFIALAALLGWGTAMVYPTFLATVAENVHPADRAKSLGIFRLWRDLGYAAGAALTGVLADFFGLPVSIFCIGLLTFASGGVIYFRMRCWDLQAVKVLDWLAGNAKRLGSFQFLGRKDEITKARFT